MRRFSRKQARRTRKSAPAALVALLGLSMLTFAMVSLQPANTLWSQELTLDANVTTAQYTPTPTNTPTNTPTTVVGGTCIPTATYTGVTTNTTANSSTYSYSVTGGGVKGPDGKPCADASYFAMPVCFDMIAANILGHTEPAHFGWDPKNKANEMLVKWEAIGAGSGPFGGIVFSFTVPGIGLSIEVVEARWHPSGPGGGTVSASAGYVYVPRMAACGSGPTYNKALDPLGDRDSDGTLNHTDNCFIVANTNQLDSNSNGIGNACEVAPTAVPQVPSQPKTSGSSPAPAPGGTPVPGAPTPKAGEGSSGGGGWADPGFRPQSPFSAYEENPLSWLPN